jgi:hypothetical protein
MAGPLFAVGRALLGSQLTQPIMNEMAIRGLGSGTLSPEVARLLYSNRTLGEQLASSVEPLGRLLGFLPEERPNYNLPDDYSVGPQGEIYNLAGDRMVTGEGVTGFQPVAQYGEYGFQEPLPPRPEGYPFDAPWPPPGAGGGFMPAAEGLLSLQQPSQEDEQERRRREWQDATGGAHGGVVANGVIAQRKRQQEEAAKMKAQAMLRAVPMPNEYRQGGRVRMI